MPEGWAALLENLGLDPCEDDQLLVRRVFSASGTNKQFVNGSPTTLANLKRIGELLVDIHGPHDHQSLLHAGRQMAVLDAYGDLGNHRIRVAELIQERNELETRKSELIVDEQTYAQQLDLLRHQVQEINAANFQPGEADALEAEHARVGNAARLLDLSQRILAALSESDDALMDRATQIGREVGAQLAGEEE